MIEGVNVEPLRKIPNDKGDIYHGLKSTDESYVSFGEAYFSNVNHGDIKGWKKHNEMVLSLIVPVGSIRFVIYDDRFHSSTFQQFFEITLGIKNYSRLTIAPGLWVSFQGMQIGQNLLLNIASIEHDPSESVNCPLEQINYNWN
ncbi:dTDP-4-dehydrorhamnose 3,5-epimerase-like enzyme [Shewanella psychrophila]|uniref:dTDP-4-dehydrorhamnose 3,5-epimerase-like enzyme n=1 Tax=Shewanella psychrophila TaxID=225848 RepID=A0A1S6HTG3_9GAMM|nr:dTDP-4-dehydrorhamnose 3,5-epimerase [Shewanella psychrophila]AQS38840.1 dTDP-4-dehydrorhamnose 3,5-epimerase-like enzyme [Shewanella psychrophila]